MHVNVYDDDGDSLSTIEANAEELYCYWISHTHRNTKHTQHCCLSESVRLDCFSAKRKYTLLYFVLIVSILRSKNQDQFVLCTYKQTTVGKEHNNKNNSTKNVE